MRLRHWISWLAIVGMVLHAGAVVRHNAIMVGQAFAGEAGTSDSKTFTVADEAGNVIIAGAICHGGGIEDDAGNSGKTKTGNERCPVCSGQLVAVGIAAPALDATISRPLTIADVVVIATAAPTPTTYFLVPPQRGPPAAV